MENRGLIFIPDISGFTNFVNKVDIEHGRMIIQELLEILVNANEIGLEISEIEGDAILFYKYGDSPDFPTLYRQVEKMFCDFHKSLLAYDISKYCQCNACTSAIDLTLKVITHYGEFTNYQVQAFKKLIGKDIIVAHQLLKNDIDQHEYWLVTNNLTTHTWPAEMDELDWNTSSKQTESGDIAYQYAPLGLLKNKIPEQSPLPRHLENKVKVMSFSKVYNTDPITLFRTSGMFEYRPRWLEGIKEVHELNHYLPRVGMSCKYVTAKGSYVLYSTDFSFHPERIEFTETDEKKNLSTTYLIEKINGDKTRLTLDLFVKKGLLSQLRFNLTGKKRLEKQVIQSLDNLDGLLKVIEFPF